MLAQAKKKKTFYWFLLLLFLYRKIYDFSALKSVETQAKKKYF